MPATPPPIRNGRFVGATEIKTVTVNFDRPVSGTYPLLRFPSSGYVIGAYVFADAASSGTNTVLVGVNNGGVTGVGTIVTAPQTNGTALAGSAYALAVATDGKEAYAIGELAMLNLTTQNATTDFDVQIDYVLDAN